jgi:hypothetical protein
MTFRLYRNGGLKQPFQRYGLAGGRPAEGGQLSLIKFFFRCRSGIFQVIGEYENYLQIAGVRIQMEFMSASSPRDISLILKEKELTADHIAEMRMALVEVTNFQNDTLFRSLSSRVSVETLNSFRLLRNFIDRFDKTSGEMFKRGNRINSWVLVFAVVAAVLGVASIWISWLSYHLAAAQVGKQLVFTRQLQSAYFSKKRCSFSHRSR